MNKNYMTALILALIALTLIVFFVFLLAGAVKDGELTLTNKTNKLEVFKDSTQLKYDFSAGEIDSIDVDLLSESFLITESDDNKIHVKFEEEAFSKMHDISVKNKTLFITSENPNILNVGNYHDARICIELPKNSNFQQVNAELKSGSIKVSDIELRAEQVSLKSHSGSIKVESVNCEDLTAKSLSGQVKIESLIAKDADCSSLSGSIKIENLIADNFIADSKSGSIEITAEKLGKTAKINAISGSVKLALPKNADFSLTCSSTSGSLKSDFGKLKKGVTFKNKGGKADISIKTTSGSVKVSAI